MSRRTTASRQPLVWLACIALALALMLVLASVVRPTGVSWRWPFDPAEDGGWLAYRLDGKIVPSSVRYSLNIRDRLVRGGYDGCNSWGFQDDNPQPNGDRMMTSNLAECSPLPLQENYRAIAFGQPRMKLIDEDMLRLETSGHSGIFRRGVDKD